MKRKPTVADLMAEIDALKREIQALKARPANVVQHHYHGAQPLLTPQIVPTSIPGDPYGPPWRLTC